MKILKLKNILWAISVLFVFAMSITACQKESATDIFDTTAMNEDQNTANLYVFEGLKLAEDVAPFEERTIEDATYFKLDKKALQKVLAQRPQSMVFNIPMSPEVMKLELEKWDIVSDEFTIEDEHGQILPFEINASFYHGKLKGDPNTNVVVSFSEDELEVTIMGKEGDRVLKKSGDLMVYYNYAKQPLLHTQKLGCSHQNAGSGAFSPEDNENVTLDVMNRSNCDFSPIRVRYTVDYSFKHYFNNSNTAVINYLLFSFNIVKGIYSNPWNIPIQFGGIRFLSSQNLLQGNSVGQKYNDFSLTYGDEASTNWDVNAAVVAVDGNGGLSSPKVGWAVGVYLMDWGNCTESAPICKRGPEGQQYHRACRPVQLIGLNEIQSGGSYIRDDHYFRYTMGHELGHHFGIFDEFDNNTNDIMDHYANPPYQLSIDHSTYVTMYYRWVPCYSHCH